ncbi:MAG: TSUP family transporter [Phenylobacterium sp.]
MSLPAALVLLAAAFGTALLSSVFGMAGGLVLMGILALLLPVQAAFVTHGILQLAANGGRAFLQRGHIRWSIIGGYAIGSVAASALVLVLAFAPSKPLLFLCLGLTPLLTWIPGDRLRLDAERPAHAVLAGLSVTGLNLTAGVAGPLLDVFFVRTAMSRHAVVATKAATQVLAHLAKTVVYGATLFRSGGEGMPSAWVLALALPLSFAGTRAGGVILDRMTDDGFRRWTRWIVTGIGAFYLVQAARLLLAP